jgi:hypothetical protein
MPKGRKYLTLIYQIDQGLARGTWGEPNWGVDGRVYSEVLPFFHRHLVFDKNQQ